MIRKYAIKLAHWILDHYQAWPPPKVQVRTIYRYLKAPDAPVEEPQPPEPPSAVAAPARSILHGLSRTGL